MTISKSHASSANVSDLACCDEQPQPEAPRRLGLVLGGGGGTGGAHLGVLAVLEELDMPIDLIVGTSVGAIGVMYAAGLCLAELEQFFHQTELRRIAAADPLRAGLIGPRKRAALTAELLGDLTFADLPIPCAVVAVDLVSGREVVIDQGPLVPALLATSASLAFSRRWCAVMSSWPTASSTICQSTSPNGWVRSESSLSNSRVNCRRLGCRPIP